jgi:hypothetical protein
MRQRALLVLVTVALASGVLSSQESTNGNLRPNVAWVGAVNTPFAPYASVPLEASASDPDGTIARVVFWRVDGTKSRVIADVSAPPYKATWTSVPPGVYSVFALALDNKNLGRNTSVYTVVVGRPPAIATFSATPDGVAAPMNLFALQWTAAGASELTIDQGVGVVTGQTSTVLAPNAPLGSVKAYTLTATNAYGTATATTDVTIGPPMINSFTADRPTVTSQGATLS